MILIAKTREKIQAEILQNPARLGKTMAFRKSLTTDFHSRVEKSGENDSSKLMSGDDTVGDENGEHFFTKRMPIQIKTKPTTQLPLRTVTEESKAKISDWMWWNR